MIKKRVVENLTSVETRESIQEPVQFKEPSGEIRNGDISWWEPYYIVFIILCFVIIGGMKLFFGINIFHYLR